MKPNSPKRRRTNPQLRALATCPPCCRRPNTLQGNVESIREQLASVVSREDDEQIHWVKMDQAKGDINLNSAPLEVGPTLRKRLFDQKDCVILTSSTLSAQGTFDYARRRLDLPEDSAELLVGSPFDYRKAALLMIPEDMPQPQTEGYVESIGQAVTDLARHLSGHTMALFTSYSALRNVNNRIRNRLQNQGIEVFGPGDRRVLLPKSAGGSLKTPNRSCWVPAASGKGWISPAASCGRWSSPDCPSRFPPTRWLRHARTNTRMPLTIIPFPRRCCGSGRASAV